MGCRSTSGRSAIKKKPSLGGLKDGWSPSEEASNEGLCVKSSAEPDGLQVTLCAAYALFDPD